MPRSPRARHLIGHVLFASALLASLAVSAGPSRAQATDSFAARTAADTAGAQRQAMLASAFARRVAEAHGLTAWDRVEEIAFTFNVRMPRDDQPARTVARSWVWRPLEDVAELTTGSGDQAETVSIPRVSQMLDDRPQGEQRAHQRFINDTYWLMFPFYLVWSEPRLGGMPGQPLPESLGIDPPAGIAEQGAWMLDVAYPSGGHTPGDIYRTYVDPLTRRLAAWEFIRGGNPPRPATFEGYAELGPLLLPLDHYGPGEGEARFRLWFTEVSLRLSDDDEVYTPRPVPVSH